MECPNCEYYAAMTRGFKMLSVADGEAKYECLECGEKFWWP